MVKLTSDRITQAYLRRWPNSKRARSWTGRMVHIETENGVWRAGGAGYTWAGKPDAWILPFEDAQRQVNHCGPEKQAAFLAVDPTKVATAPEVFGAALTALPRLAAAAGCYVGITVTEAKAGPKS